MTSCAQLYSEAELKAVEDEAKRLKEEKLQAQKERANVCAHAKSSNPLDTSQLLIRLLFNMICSALQAKAEARRKKEEIKDARILMEAQVTKRKEEEKIQLLEEDYRH